MLRACIRLGRSSSMRIRLLTLNSHTPGRAACASKSIEPRALAAIITAMTSSVGEVSQSAPRSRRPGCPQHAGAVEQRLHALGQMHAGIARHRNCLSPIIGLSGAILSRPNLIDDHEKVLKYVGTMAAGMDVGGQAACSECYRTLAARRRIAVDLAIAVQVRLAVAACPGHR